MVIHACWRRLKTHLSRDMTKPTKVTVRPAKTRISLGIRPVWSESSLSPWRKLGSLATHWAHSEDWSDEADALDDLSLRWAHSPFVGFVMPWLIWSSCGHLLDFISAHLEQQLAKKVVDGTFYSTIIVTVIFWLTWTTFRKSYCTTSAAANVKVLC